MPDSDEAGHTALEEEEGMHPADAAPIGVNGSLERHETQCSKKGKPGRGPAATRTC